MNETNEEMKCLLITGGAGFIGSHYVNSCIDILDRVKIIVYDRLDYCSRRQNWNINITTSPNFIFIQGDLNETLKINRILSEYEITHVIHFAAQTHVDNSFGNSISFTRDNVLGTHSLLEACREWGGIKRFIHISTDEVYGEVSSENKGCFEKDLLNPTNPYAATKAAAEFLVRSYAYSFNLPIIITRGNNVYGTGQYPEKLIPRFAILLGRGKKCTIHGKGASRRNFIHVSDVVNAMRIIMERGVIGEIYNIGTKNEYSVMEITKMMVTHMKSDQIDNWITYVPDRNFNDYRYAIRTEKLTSLGWKETMDFETGLRDTINFYVKHIDEWSYL